MVYYTYGGILLPEVAALHCNAHKLVGVPQKCCLVAFIFYFVVRTCSNECSIFPYVYILAYNSCHLFLPFIQLACLVGGLLVI